MTTDSDATFADIANSINNIKGFEFQEGITGASTAQQWSGGYGSVTFTTPFSTTPKVAFIMNGQDCRAVRISATQTGFSYSFINATGSTISCSFSWIAFAEK